MKNNQYCCCHCYLCISSVTLVQKLKDVQLTTSLKLPIIVEKLQPYTFAL